jgi:polar amino acid transport system substrate-binding protein
MKFIMSLVVVLPLVLNTFMFTDISLIALAQTESESAKSKDYTESQKKLIEYGLQPQESTVQPQESTVQPQESIEPTDTIRQIQKNLKDLGYYQSIVDGIVGPRTRQAIIDFQNDLDLPITGTIDSELTKYISRPTLILNTQDFAPFHYQISTFKNKIYGPVPDAIKSACLEAEINCLMKLYNWGEAQKLVQDNKAHGLFVIGWNADRAQWLHRSVPIIETEYGLFVRDDNPLDFKQIDSLDQYTIGVYGPSNTSRSVRTIESTLKSRGLNVNIKETKDDKPLFQELANSSGNYAVYSNRDVGKTIISGLGLDNIRYAGVHKKLLYYVGFSKELVDEQIVDRFNRAFMKLQDQGVIQEIYANSGLNKIEDTTARAEIEPPKDEVKPVSRYDVKTASDREIILDQMTCLVWQRSGSDQEINWNEAQSYISTINQENYAGYSDWRLPKLKELQSLLASDIQKDNRLYINAVFDAMQQTCWSDDGTDDDRQFIDFYEGTAASKNQLDTNFVRAVRGTNCQEPSQ